MSLLAILFTHPQNIADRDMWIIIPLSLAVAVVYKSIRTEHIRHLPREILLLTAYILAGVVGLMLAGWAVISFKG